MKLTVLRTKLLRIIYANSRHADIVHESEHTMRVLSAAEKIARAESADLEIIILAALFHDFIISPKHNPKSRADSKLSADFTKLILNSLGDYPKAIILAKKLSMFTKLLGNVFLPRA